MSVWQQFSTRTPDATHKARITLKGRGHRVVDVIGNTTLVMIGTSHGAWLKKFAREWNGTWSDVSILIDAFASALCGQECVDDDTRSIHELKCGACNRLASNAHEAAKALDVLAPATVTAPSGGSAQVTPGPKADPHHGSSPKWGLRTIPTAAETNARNEPIISKWVCPHCDRDDFESKRHRSGHQIYCEENPAGKANRAKTGELTSRGRRHPNVLHVGGDSTKPVPATPIPAPQAATESDMGLRATQGWHDQQAAVFDGIAEVALNLATRASDRAAQIRAEGSEATAAIEEVEKLKNALEAAEQRVSALTKGGL
jgi:hypothetical protein